jgi:hypothetical protein
MKDFMGTELIAKRQSFLMSRVLRALNVFVVLYAAAVFVNAQTAIYFGIA